LLWQAERTCACRTSSQGRFVFAASCHPQYAAVLLTFDPADPVRRVTLIRNWGRMARVAVMMRTFEDRATEREAFGRLERAKRGRGSSSAEEKV